MSYTYTSLCQSPDSKSLQIVRSEQLRDGLFLQGEDWERQLNMLIITICRTINSAQNTETISYVYMVFMNVPRFTLHRNVYI